MPKSLKSLNDPKSQGFSVSGTLSQGLNKVTSSQDFRVTRTLSRLWSDTVCVRCKLNSLSSSESGTSGGFHQRWDKSLAHWRQMWWATRTLWCHLSKAGSTMSVGASGSPTRHLSAAGRWRHPAARWVSGCTGSPRRSNLTALEPISRWRECIKGEGRWVQLKIITIIKIMKVTSNCLQLLQHSSDSKIYLRVATGKTTWVIHDTVDGRDGWIQSAAAGGMSPADPPTGWQYSDNGWKDGDITILSLLKTRCLLEHWKKTTWFHYFQYRSDLMEYLSYAGGLLYWINTLWKQPALVYHLTPVQCPVSSARAVSLGVY